MRGAYDFVKEHARGALSDGALARLRQEVVPGSHAELILKEALLDRAYGAADVAAGLASLDPSDYVVSSFPTPALAGTPLNVRSEFLILRHVGDSPMRAEAIEDWIAATLRAFAPLRIPRMVYRLCDYNEHDFSFFPFSGRRHGDPPRGAQRLVDDVQFLEMDLRMIDGFLCAGIEVDVLVPFVQFPAQFVTLKERITAFFASRARRPRRVGAVLEVPSNLFEVEKLADGDFFVFGVNDLLKYFYGGVDRNSRHYQKTDVRLVLGPIGDCMRALDAIGGKTVYLMKSLVALAEQLPLAHCTRTVTRRFVMANQLTEIAAAASPRAQSGHAVHSDENGQRLEPA